MTKKKWAKLCRWAAGCLTAAFVIAVLRDWSVYSTTLNSAPFRLWVLVDAVYFLLPAAILLVVGHLLKRR